MNIREEIEEQILDILDRVSMHNEMGIVTGKQAIDTNIDAIMFIVQQEIEKAIPEDKRFPTNENIEYDTPIQGIIYWNRFSSELRTNLRRSGLLPEEE